MYASALMAFLHHAAAFTVVAALAVEIALFRPPLTSAQARRLMIADNVFGAAAGIVLVFGLLRVAFFEKGPHYYWHDLFFLTKFGTFLAAALISIYPTVVFLSWRKNITAGIAPQIAPECTRRVRRCMMLEFAALIVIVFCAAFMARGFGSLR
jgi:putative membrane protein